MCYNNIECEFAVRKSWQKNLVDQKEVLLSFILINRGEIQTHGLQHDAPIPLEFQKSITWELTLF